MSTYLVTIDRPNVPAARIGAADWVDLGEQVARHLARHRLIRPGNYAAEIGDAHGAIHQDGLRRPVAFTIRKES